MNEAIISVAEAAEDLRKVVKRAQAESLSFVMTENGVPVARIIPEARKERACSGAELVKALSRIDTAPVDFDNWREELREARKTLLPPRHKWE
jgi:antitoxin (DNA-binding transcriptional repressor) of toxin-antitoxin stability system